MEGRLNAMAMRCSRRGGDCPCSPIECQAYMAIIKLVDQKTKELKELRDAIDWVCTPLATLKEGFKFREGLTPCVHFDFDEAHFGYEDDDGEWHDAEWPFNEDRIYPDDCEKLGIKVV